MKEQWLKLVAQIDALALRERVAIFAGLTLALVYLVYMLVAEPLMAKQRLIQQQITDQGAKMVQLQGQIDARIASAKADPDAAARLHLEALLNEQTALGTSLRTVQRGLVAPEKMAPLLERILQANGRLKLMSLRSLPVTTVNEAAPLSAVAEKIPADPEQPPSLAMTPADDVKAVVATAAQQAAAGEAPAGTPAAASVSAVPAPKAREMLYRHGVEMTVQGSYADMVAYMEALEKLPVQLFWGKAVLDASNYREAKLTLTLYTLSLDDKWMKL